MILHLPGQALEQVKSHACEAYPRECCGIFLGGVHEKRWEVREAYPARNLADEGVQDRYLMDPADRLRAEEVAKKRGLAVMGFYHSHPDHGAYFSQTDLHHSEEYLMGQPWLPPCYAYLVLSIRDRVPRETAAFVVREGRSEPISIEIV